MFADQEFARGSRTGKNTDFLLDAVVLPSPYASSFGGFFNVLPVLWYGLGGVIGSSLDAVQHLFRAREPRPAEGEVPADMSTTSLVGGGLIAGDSLSALTVGISGLARAI